MRVGGQRHAPAGLPPERPGTYCIGGWVGPRAGLDGCGKISSPPGFDTRTVQPVASCYTHWAIPAHSYGLYRKLRWEITSLRIRMKNYNTTLFTRRFALNQRGFNPLNPELNLICFLLALLGAHHFLHVSRIRVKLLTFRRLMSFQVSG